MLELKNRNLKIKLKAFLKFWRREMKEIMNLAQKHKSIFLLNYANLTPIKINIRSAENINESEELCASKERKEERILFKKERNE